MLGNKYLDKFIKGGLVELFALLASEIEILFLRKTNKEIARLYEE